MNDRDESNDLVPRKKTRKRAVVKEITVLLRMRPPIFLVDRGREERWVMEPKDPLGLVIGADDGRKVFETN